MSHNPALHFGARFALPVFSEKLEPACLVRSVTMLNWRLYERGMYGGDD